MKLLKQLFAIRKKVLFIDLDGTLITPRSAHSFPVDKDDWQFMPSICDAITNLGPEKIFIITNQGGIESGHVKKEEFIDKMDTILRRLSVTGCKVDYMYCPSNNVMNPFRKPNTGMLDYFYNDYIHGNNFVKSSALMVGDASGKQGQRSDTDLLTARNFGIDYLDVEDFIKIYA